MDVIYADAAVKRRLEIQRCESDRALFVFCREKRSRAREIRERASDSLRN